MSRECPFCTTIRHDLDRLDHPVHQRYRVGTINCDKDHFEVMLCLGCGLVYSKRITAEQARTFQSTGLDPIMVLRGEKENTSLDISVQRHQPSPLLIGILLGEILVWSIILLTAWS